MQSDSNHPELHELQAAVERACQPTHARYILEGRERVSKLPRDWVLTNIERVGRNALNFADYWEYGRFLEVLEVVGAFELIHKFVAEGLQSSEFDVRDMAESWSERGTSAAG